MHGCVHGDSHSSCIVYYCCVTYRYFSLQATSPLYFGDSVRLDIENKICDESGPRVDSYGTAQKLAYDKMNEVYL